MSADSVYVCTVIKNAMQLGRFIFLREIKREIHFAGIVILLWSITTMENNDGEESATWE